MTTQPPDSLLEQVAKALYPHCGDGMGNLPTEAAEAALAVLQPLLDVDALADALECELPYRMGGSGYRALAERVLARITENKEPK